MLGSLRINLKGDLFATAFCFFSRAILRLGSSLILTRILRPEAYGTITVLTSVVFVVEMLGDIGVNLFIVREKDGDQPRYLNTAWTMRLARAVLNSAVLFALAPVVASSIYGIPSLDVPLRVFSAWFVISALESMSFPLAIRRKQARIIVYTELGSQVVSTAFTVAYCAYTRDFWGLVYGTLLNRMVTTALSYQFYRDLRPRLHFDWNAAKEILGTTRFTMPSSMLTLALSQFDKVVFLRLFTLKLLGIYGLAGNIAGTVESLIASISQSVLYPRCAHNFRTDPATSTQKYYTENIKLFSTILIAPAAIGGSAQLIVAVLYPSGYAQSGEVLQALMLRATLLSLASPAEDLLIAAGNYHVILFGNVLRAAWMFSASLLGYYFLGFMGFVYGVSLSGLPPLVYYLLLQHKKGMMILRYELYKLVFIVAVALSSYLASGLMLQFLPTDFPKR